MIQILINGFDVFEGVGKRFAVSELLRIRRLIIATGGLCQSDTVVIITYFRLIKVRANARIRIGGILIM
ncbi:MAG TPA: hypothetical protein VFH39_00785 [Candidatus Saccharimonadales bacterium]|nr:hypothetical protein [Candidatus Saccharimonadales bacterium]